MVRYCDTCPGHLSASPWQRRKFTCTQSPWTDRSQLRLLRRGLQKPQQHRVWWATTPEGSRLMFVPISFQKAVDRSARHTSTGHRTHCTQNGRRTGSRRTEEASQTHWHHHFIYCSINTPSGDLFSQQPVVWFFSPPHWWRMQAYCWRITDNPQSP